MPAFETGFCHQVVAMHSPKTDFKDKLERRPLFLSGWHNWTGITLLNQ